MFTPNLGILEIHLTYRCTARCPNCLCQCSQAPAVDELPIESVQQLIDDSIRLKWPWKMFRLHGGEAILHGRFEDICQLLADYWHRHNPGMVEIRVLTNGNGAKWRAKCDAVEKMGITPGISIKPWLVNAADVEPMRYVTVNMSRVDAGLPAKVDGCYMTADCGIAINNRGFYPCSAAAGAARVLNHKPAATRLDDVTVESMQMAFAWCCLHCGFAGIESNGYRSHVQETSATWAAALAEYRKSHD